MRRNIIPALLLLAAAGLLVGCGQKGPLYLPTRPAATPQPASTASAARPTDAGSATAPVAGSSG